MCVCVYTYICKNIYVCVCVYDEMVGWHHRLDGHEFEQAPGVGDGQGSLESYSPGSHKVLDTTE